MPWGRCDDSFYDHPKVRAMSVDVRNAAAGLYWRAISLSNRLLSDGRVSPADVALLDGSESEVGELVRVRLWRQAKDGYRINDYLEFNKSRAEVTAEREKKASAGRLGGLRSGQARGKQPRSKNEAPASPVVEPPTRPSPVPSASYEASVGASDADALVAYHSLTGRFPNGRVKDWLDQLVRDFSDDAVEKALAAEMVANSAVQTLLSRTANRLRLDEHDAQKRREASARQAEEDERRRIDAMPPEQRAANLERLRQLMAEKGLVVGVRAPEKGVA